MYNYGSPACILTLPTDNSFKKHPRDCIVHKPISLFEVESIKVAHVSYLPAGMVAASQPMDIGMVVASQPMDVGITLLPNSYKKGYRAYKNR
jgi:hypothetical protein